MKQQQTKETPPAGITTPRRAFVVPEVKSVGKLMIHFCSGINLWDGTGGTIQCR